jgi:hypothetical protein
MGVEKHSKINNLQRDLPEGLLATAAWLNRKGYSNQLVRKYEQQGWLVSPAHGVYRRPGPPLKWQHVVYSLGQMLPRPPHVGGISALELRGYAHFLKLRGSGRIHLYCEDRLPAWVQKLDLPEKFVEHRDRLFTHRLQVATLAGNEKTGGKRTTDAVHGGLSTEPWGPWDWDLLYSTPEQAVLEFLDEVPRNQSVEHADEILGGLADLSSRRILKLLGVCKSVKVKRLFLALASRHSHTWVKSVVQAADRGEVDLGKGKRSLVPGGKLDRKYLITLPEKPDVQQ